MKVCFHVSIGSTDLTSIWWIIFRYSWSDRTGKLSITKENVKLPTLHWQWSSDWLIDFSTPGGADHDGWQYATDFPATYHSSKKFTDYVRRRRWTRKCNLSTTGPWKVLGSTKLIDVSMKAHPVKDLVYVWAITSKGEALFRTGVSSRCPEGLTWQTVTSDLTFVSVTIMGKGSDIGNVQFSLTSWQFCTLDGLLKKSLQLVKLRYLTRFFHKKPAYLKKLFYFYLKAFDNLK